MDTQPKLLQSSKRHLEIHKQYQSYSYVYFIKISKDFTAKRRMDILQ